MSAEKSLKYLVRELVSKVEACQAGLAEFRHRLEKDADNAFEWGMNPMMFAANEKIAKQLLEHIKRLKDNGNSDEAILKTLYKGLQREAISKARWPERSTSPTANIMAQERGMVYAEWFTKVETYMSLED